MISFFLIALGISILVSLIVMFVMWVSSNETLELIDFISDQEVKRDFLRYIIRVWICLLMIFFAISLIVMGVQEV